MKVLDFSYNPLHCRSGEWTDLSLTIIGWILSYPIGEHKIWLSRGAYKQDGWYIWRGSNKYLWVALNAEGTIEEYETGGPFFEDNKWVYVAIYFDDTIVKFYKNGQQFNVKDVTIDWIVKSDRKLVVGAYDNYGYSVKGIIADLAIYNIEKTQDEIRENMYRSPIYRMLRGLPRSFVQVPRSFNILSHQHLSVPVL